MLTIRPMRNPHLVFEGMRSWFGNRSNFLPSATHASSRIHSIFSVHCCPNFIGQISVLMTWNGSHFPATHKFPNGIQLPSHTVLQAVRPLHARRRRLLLLESSTRFPPPRHPATPTSPHLNLGCIARLPLPPYPPIAISRRSRFRSRRRSRHRSRRRSRRRSAAALAAGDPALSLLAAIFPRKVSLLAPRRVACHFCGRSLLPPSKLRTIFAAYSR